MKKIIHLSDLHTGAGDNLDRTPEAITDALLERYSGREDEFVIVITGDLVERASPGDLSLYALVQEQLNRLTAAGFELVLVPGNHDLGTGSNGDPRMVRIFEESFYGDVKRFPRLFCKGGIAFVVLNSLAEELHWFDKRFAQGEIGDVQLDYMVHQFLRAESRACEKRVLCLHHHPFDWLPLHQLRDNEKLQSTLEERVMGIADGVTVDAILYGHNHRGNDRCDEWQIPRAYDAGSATLKHSTTALTPRSCIREIDLDAEPESDRVILEP